jgi:hypothetical protein
VQRNKRQGLRYARSRYGDETPGSRSSQSVDVTASPRLLNPYHCVDCIAAKRCGVAAGCGQFRRTLGKIASADKLAPMGIRLQALLDRAHCSPGEIDGKFGEDAKKALRAYAEA